jgi:aminopeptidase N
MMSAAWDMTRDAEMGTSAFIDLIEKALPLETFIPIIQRVLMQTRTAAQLYSHPDNREKNMLKLADAYLNWARTLPAGSDAQFASAKNFVGIARTDEQLAVVAGLLDGSVEIKGIKVDADFRWMLLSRLAASGRVGEAEIAKEEAADVTSDGKRNAATARALIPTAENKKRVWQTLLNDAELSNEITGAMVGGFMDLDKRELSADYVKPYFEMLPKLWETRSNEIAQTLTNGLFPAIQISQSTVDAANEFLKKDEVPYGCKRLVGEGRDGLVRSLAAQAADK